MNLGNLKSYDEIYGIGLTIKYNESGENISYSIGTKNYRKTQYRYRSGKINERIDESRYYFKYANKHMECLCEEAFNRTVCGMDESYEKITNHFGLCSKAYMKDIKKFIHDIANYCTKLKIDKFEVVVNIYVLTRILYMPLRYLKEDYHLGRFEIYILLGNYDEKYSLHEFLDGFADQLYEKYDEILDKINRLSLIMNDMKTRVSVIEGNYDCIISSSFAGLIAHESIGHLAEADTYQLHSNSDNALHQQVGPACINVIDHTKYDQDLTLLPFPLFYDDEGNETKDVNIIEDGMFRELMNDEEYSLKYDNTKTGNSIIGNNRNEKMIRMRNVGFKKGNNNLSDMIKSINEGYYLVTPGFGFTLPNGLFEIEIVLGFKITNGIIEKPIKKMYACAKCIDFLNSISLISNKMRWTGATCNKQDVEVYLGMGGPALKARLILMEESLINKLIITND